MPALGIIKQKIQGAGAGALLVTNCHFHKHPAMQSRKYVELMMMLLVIIIQYLLITVTE